VSWWVIDRCCSRICQTCAALDEKQELDTYSVPESMMMISDIEIDDRICLMRFGNILQCSPRHRDRIDAAVRRSEANSEMLYSLNPTS